MKKIVSIVLAVAMLLMCSVCFAESDSDNVLHVGTNPEFAPFEYVDDEGNIAGIDVDIINEVAKDLGMTVEMEAMEFDALVPSLVSGKLDATIAGMTITEERKQSVLFSDPYFNSTQVVILPVDSEIKTMEDLNGKRIGVQLGTTGDLLVTDTFTDADISRYNKGMDAAMDIVNGRLDAVVIDTLPARQFVASIEGLEVHDDILTDVEVESYGIAIPMGQDELLEKINASLKRMQEDGTMDAILLKYSDDEEETTEETAETTEETTETTEETAEETTDATAGN